MQHRSIFTIGHSNHSREEFLCLLVEHGIQVVADVRSQPYSRYSPHFDQGELQCWLRESGIEYLYLGKEIGGRPQSTEYYDEQGYVLYSKLAESEVFHRGIRSLERAAEEKTVVIMCSEEDPSRCHRHLLISRVLTGHGFEVMHVRGDSHLQTESALVSVERKRKQLALFGEEEDEWKSIQSVSPRRQQPNSLGF